MQGFVKRFENSSHCDEQSIFISALCHQLSCGYGSEEARLNAFSIIAVTTDSAFFHSSSVRRGLWICRGSYVLMRASSSGRRVSSPLLCAEKRYVCRRMLPGLVPERTLLSSRFVKS